MTAVNSSNCIVYADAPKFPLALGNSAANGRRCLLRSHIAPVRCPTFDRPTVALPCFVSCQLCFVLSGSREQVRIALAGAHVLEVTCEWSNTILPIRALPFCYRIGAGDLSRLSFRSHHRQWLSFTILRQNKRYRGVAGTTSVPGWFWSLVFDAVAFGCEDRSLRIPLHPPHRGASVVVKWFCAWRRLFRYGGHMRMDIHLAIQFCCIHGTQQRLGCCGHGGHRHDGC